MRYEPFTFSTGITAQVGKVSPTLIAEIETTVRRQWAAQAPQVPEEVVQTPHGPGAIANPHDETYLAAQAAFDAAVAHEVSRRWLDFAILRAVDLVVDETALAQIEAEYEAVNGEALPRHAQRKIDYVRRVAVGSWEDLGLLQALITRRSIPTEEGIQAHEATF